MTDTAPLCILFTSERAANSLVAGIPAAARALGQMQAVGEKRTIVFGVPGGWEPSALCRREAKRLAPDAVLSPVDPDVVQAAGWINGAAVQALPTDGPLPIEAHRESIVAADVTDLAKASQRIIAATGKPGDGIVSRHINRPMSQAITRIVLHIPGARPWHATFAAGLIGLVMLACLVFGGHTGLLAGAALFQLASIIDGVDGEMARATFRSSARGAMMDSLTDAATNLGFLGGVSYNVYMGGDTAAGIAGALAVVILANGSAMLGWQARRDGGNFTFDGLKHRFGARPSRLRQWLTWIAMRDFYALAAFVMILLGGASILLYAFAIIAAGWFAVLCAFLPLWKNNQSKSD